MVLIGRHLSVAKIGIIGAINKSIENGLDCCQCFIGNPRGTPLSKITDLEKKEIKELILKNNFKLVIHAKYIYNLSKEFEPKEWTLTTLQKELELANSIGAVQLVIHMGKALKLNKETAGNNFITSVKYIIKFMKEYEMNIKLSLEVSTGCGTEMFYRIEEFALMFNSFNDNEKKYLSCTYDTCHSYSAGHNLNIDTDKYLNYIKKHIGLKYLSVFHLNGSKVNCGAKVDRHSNLKDGFINYDILLKIAQFGIDNNIIIITETPDTDSEGIKECLQLIKDLQIS